MLVCLIHRLNQLSIKRLILAQGGKSALGNFLVKLDLFFLKHIACVVTEVFRVRLNQLLELIQTFAVSDALFDIVADSLHTRAHA